MNIKMSDLSTLERCEKRYQMNRLGIVTKKGKNYFLSIAMRETVKHLLMLTDLEFKKVFNLEYIFDYLNSNISDDLFLPLVKKEVLKEISLEIQRYVVYVKNAGGVVVKTDIIQDIKVCGQLVTVTADFIIQHESGIAVVKLKKSEPKLSYAARTFENMPHNNIELYLLQAVGEYLYPGKAVIGSFHHMTSKNDNKEFIPAYNSKRGYNIISYQFKEKEIKGIEERISELIVKLNSNKFSKTCNTQECQTCSYKNICHYKKSQDLVAKKINEVNKAPKDFALTETQREAVLQESGIVRINAGAGSGKTTVVALRVAELIIGGCKPEDILLITFTNKGAVEMREKVAYWLKKEGMNIKPERFNITTFNAWGDGIIQRKYKTLGFSEAPRLIEKVDKYDILFSLLNGNEKLEGYDYKNPLMNFRHAKGVIVKLDNIFNYMKAHSITEPESLIGKVEDSEIAKVMELYKEYNDVLKKNNYIEYQDQINLLMDLTENKPEELKDYDYKHLIVDEFQDSDEAQLDLILFLSKQSKFESLMIVGDDAQSIFGFRNTSQENILNFHIYFDEVIDINMIENFRSTPEIIALANAINDLNSEKIDKQLVSGLKSGEKPELISFLSYEDEYLFITAKIKELLKDNKPEDFAIIARTKSELFNIEEYLKEENIPYVIDIPEPLLNNTNIHIAKSFSSFLDDLETTQGLFEYLYVISNEFKDMNEDEIKAMMKENVDKIKEEIESASLIGEGDTTRFNIFFEKLKEIKDEDFNNFLMDLKNRSFTFGQLKSYLSKFIEYEDGKTVEKTNDKYSAVTLTTAHTSKGKEFKVVFNTISKFKADVSLKAKDEERRTLFVSLTRAKEKLFVTHQRYDGSKLKRIPHQFGKEVENTGLCNVSEYESITN